MLDLQTVMFGSEDPKQLIEFYKGVLGDPTWEESDYTGWQAGAGMLMIGPHSEVKGTNGEPGRIILNFETPDFQQEFERIKGLGATVKAEPYQPGGDTSGQLWLATFADPDGNLFQLATPMPSTG